METSNLDLTLVLREVVKLWKLKGYGKLTSYLSTLPRDTVLEVLVCAADAVSTELRMNYLRWLGKDSDEHLDLYIMLGCEPAYKEQKSFSFKAA